MQEVHKLQEEVRGLKEQLESVKAQDSPSADSSPIHDVPQKQCQEVKQEQGPRARTLSSFKSGMFCACGNEFFEDSTFCRKCGRARYTAQESSEEEIVDQVEEKVTEADQVEEIVVARHKELEVENATLKGELERLQREVQREKEEAAAALAEARQESAAKKRINDLKLRYQAATNSQSPLSHSPKEDTTPSDHPTGLPTSRGRGLLEDWGSIDSPMVSPEEDADALEFMESWERDISPPKTRSSLGDPAIPCADQH